MMKHQRLFILVLIAVLVLSLAGCNKGTEVDSGDSPISRPSDTTEDYNEPEEIVPDDTDHISTVFMSTVPFEGVKADKDVTLFEDDKVRIAYWDVSKWISDDISSIEIRVENKTKDTIFLMIDNVVLNGIDVTDAITGTSRNIELKYSNAVPGESEKLVNLDCRNKYLNDICNINNIFTLSMDFKAYHDSKFSSFVTSGNISFRLMDGDSEFIIVCNPIQLYGPVQFGVSKIFIDKEFNTIGMACMIYNNADDKLEIDFDRASCIFINGQAFPYQAIRNKIFIEQGRYRVLNIEFSMDDLANAEIYSVNDIKQISIKPTYKYYGSSLEEGLGTWVINLSTGE